MALIERRVAYHEQAYNIIKDKILSKEFAPGQKIVESALSEELGISRSPVREALRMLESERLLVKQGGGLAVIALDDAKVAEIYDIRYMTESFAVSRSTKDFSAAEIQWMCENVIKSRSLHEKKEWAAVAANNTEFHEFLISKCTNTILLDYLQQINSLVRLLRSKEFVVYERGVGYLDEHDEIIAAIEKGEPELVEQCVRKHIANDKVFALAGRQKEKQI